MDLISICILLTGIFGFYMAWNIGANDVANAMGTSVGSKALTYKQAIIVAAVFEFAGALLVGGQVTSTIQSKVLDVHYFEEGRVEQLVLGMMSALLAAGIWLQFATWRGWPNSTTHAIVGGLLGFGIVTGGFSIIKWDTISRIMISWVVSPIAGAVVAWLMFLLILRGIIRRPDPRQAMVQVVPLILFVFFFVITLSLFYKGLARLNIELSTVAVFILATVIGAIAAIAGYIILPRVVAAGRLGHSRRQVEKVFAVLQVMTACYMAFAHGANDVANAIGPLAAVVAITRGGIGALTETVPIWILCLGGSGIVIGLATWGYRVIETIGHSITGIAPTRGFAAEFAAATTVLVCSKLGLPVSTTHVLVGAVVGIGLLRGLQSINLNVLKQVVLSWLTTVPVAAGLCAAIYWILKGILALIA